MNENEKTFLEIINRAITEDYRKDTCFQNADWKQIFKLCYDNGVASIVYDVVREQECVEENLKKQWEMFRLRSFIQEKKKIHSLKNVLETIKKAGKDVTVFKGYVLADLYPQPAYRSSSDSDLLAREEDMEAIADCLCNCGYVHDKKHSKSNVWLFNNEQTGHKIELHGSLYEEYQGKQIDLLNNMQLDAKEKRIHSTVCGIELDTLGYEEHLIYQMFHIIKHFIVEGVGVRYLADITLFINRYANDINWKDFWSKIKLLGYEEFCKKFYYICCHYLGMTNLVFKSMEVTYQEEDVEAFLKDLICKGKISEKDFDSWQILGIMIPYLVGDGVVSKNKWKRKLQVLFPERKKLPERYAYAQKNVFLLPVAWVHRWIYFLIRRNKRKESWYSPTQKVTMAEYRLALLQDVGLAAGN